MRYVLYFHDQLDKLVAENLSNELARYDIRSEIFISSSRSEVIRHLNGETVDLLVEIGDRCESLFSKLVRKQRTKRLLLFQTKRQRSRVPNNRMPVVVVVDLHTKDSSLKYFGNPLIDVVRSFSSVVDTPDVALPQVVVVNESGTSRKVVGALSKLSSDRFQCTLVDLASDFEAAIQLIQQSHAAIVTSNRGELMSLQLNTPAIRVNHFGLFGKSRFSVLNHIADQPIISVHGHYQNDLIKSSLVKILSDHNFCAGILQDYQMVKSQIGTEPSIRKIAQYVIEWLEEAMQPSTY